MNPSSADLANKLVLVTGSTEGIGYASARAYALLGARVVLNGRSQVKVDAAVERLFDSLPDEANVHRPFGIAADVGSAEGAAALIAAVRALDTPLSVLVNNVAVYSIEEFTEASDEVWQRHFDVNVMSAVRISRAFLPDMLARCATQGTEQPFARILMISSETGLRPLTQFLHYSVTKAALISLARGLAELTRGTNVTVNSVLPGPTMTEGVENYLRDLADKRGLSLEAQTKQYFSENEPNSLIERFLTPQEIADVIVFLSSRAASGINGVAQKVEGGLIRHL